MGRCIGRTLRRCEFHTCFAMRTLTVFVESPAETTVPTTVRGADMFADCVLRGEDAWCGRECRGSAAVGGLFVSPGKLEVRCMRYDSVTTTLWHRT
jgi:hypothetical protein